MRFSFSSSQLLTSGLLAFLSTISQTEAANRFAGIGASNSVTSGTYRCRTQAEWNSLAITARDNGFKSIRITGFDCAALDMVSQAAAAAGLTVLAGIWISGTVAQSTASVNDDVQWFRQAYAKYGAGRYKGLTIGNEVADSVGNIAARVADVRGYLRSVGVNTPVSTVHTWVAIRDNPAALCIGDFVGANAHAFYDGNVLAANAGDFLFNTVVPSLKNACPGKPVFITETGWPSRGSANGRAIPSVDNERAALANLNCASARDSAVSVYAFEADDQLWKGDDRERSFGIFGKNILASAVSTC